MASACRFPSRSPDASNAERSSTNFKYVIVPAAPRVTVAPTAIHAHGGVVRADDGRSDPDATREASDADNTGAGPEPVGDDCGGPSIERADDSPASSEKERSITLPSLHSKCTWCIPAVTYA